MRLLHLPIPVSMLPLRASFLKAERNTATLNGANDYKLTPCPAQMIQHERFVEPWIGSPLCALVWEMSLNASGSIYIANRGFITRSYVHGFTFGVSKYWAMRCVTHR